MANVAVIGAQWGDEGKGKIVDWLSERAEIVVSHVARGCEHAPGMRVVGIPSERTLGVGFGIRPLPVESVEPGELAPRRSRMRTALARSLQLQPARAGG